MNCHERILFLLSFVVWQLTVFGHVGTRTQLDTIKEVFQQVSFIQASRYEPWAQALNRSKLVLETDLDHKCVQLLMVALTNPYKNQWSAQMLHSTGSMLSQGSFSGTVTSFGDFDTCVSIDEPYNDQSTRVKGKYCLMTLSLPVNESKPIDYAESKHSQPWPINFHHQWLLMDKRYPFATGLCLPTFCDERLIKQILLQVYSPIGQLSVNVDYCQTAAKNIEPNHRRSLFIILVLFIPLLVLISIGTIWDVWFETKPSDGTTAPVGLSCVLTWRNVFTSFSLTTNCSQLFNTQSTDGKIMLQFINGIRVILTLLVIISHVSANQAVIQLGTLSPFARFPCDYQQQIESIHSHYLINSTFTIKSYFMLSGFLLAITTFYRKRSSSFGRYLLTRWLRFTPSVLGYVAFTILLGAIGSGPLFHSKLIDPYIRPCVENIWSQLFYFNNWNNFNDMCGFQMWYISADMQLYILAFPVMHFLFKNRLFWTIAISIFFIIVSYLISIVLFAFNEQGIPFFVSVLYPQLTIPTRGYFLYWTATYNHLEAYFFGIIIGIVVGKRWIIKFKNFVLDYLWSSSILILLLLPHTFPWFWKNRQTRSLLDLVDSHSWIDACTMTIAHACWLLILAWIFYSGSIHHTIGGYCNTPLRFLSAKIFTPFSRISFAMFLSHVPLTWFLVHQSRYPQIRNDFGNIQFVLQIIFNSILSSIALYLLFEAPFTRLTSLIFRYYDLRTLNQNVKSTISL